MRTRLTLHRHDEHFATSLAVADLPAVLALPQERLLPRLAAFHTRTCPTEDMLLDRLVGIKSPSWRVRDNLVAHGALGRDAVDHRRRERRSALVHAGEEVWLAVGLFACRALGSA